MGKILDTNRNTFGHYDALKAAGVTTVIRYLAAGLEGHEKVIKQGEAHAIADAGLRLDLVYETDGRPNGAAVGARDGAAAKIQAIAVGAPQDGTAIIWYTDDQDRPENEMAGLIAAIKAFAAALGTGFRVGIYGSGAVCDELWNLKLVAGRWITDSHGFRGSRASIAAGRYEMLQALPATIAGLDTDPDAAHIGVDGMAADIGDFVPFAPDADPVYPQPGRTGL